MSADLEFHILELPKFTKAVEELASGLDIWLYFLRHAAMIDPEALPASLDRPLVRRACEELKMLTQDEVERERYEARLKAQLDHNTLLRAARSEGRAEGEQIGQIRGEQIGQIRGEQIGQIHAYERILHRPETPTERLAALSLEELTRLADELQVLLKGEPNSRMREN